MIKTAKKYDYCRLNNLGIIMNSSQFSYLISKTSLRLRSGALSFSFSGDLCFEA